MLFRSTPPAPPAGRARGSVFLWYSGLSKRITERFRYAAWKESEQNLLFSFHCASRKFPFRFLHLLFRNPLSFRHILNTFSDYTVLINKRNGRIFIPASNEPSGHACMSIWRLPRGSNTPQLCCAASLMPRSLLRGL